MIIKICDRCKIDTRNNPARVTPRIIEIFYENWDGSLKDWIGVKKSFDLCDECFNEFLKFTKPNE